MKRLALLLFLLLFGARATAAPAAAGDDHEQPDLVSALEVKADLPPGPAWWRISNGRSTVWAMGIPEAFSADVRWDSSVLARRIIQADKVIFPTDLWRPATSPSDGEILGKNALISVPAPSRKPAASPPSFSTRFDPVLAARLERQISGQSDSVRSNLLNLKTYELALWLQRMTWPNGPLANTAVETTLRLTPSRKQIRLLGMLPAVRGGPPTLASRYYSSNLPPPEALQQRCLSDILTLLEDPRTIPVRQAAMQAWAVGNVDKALKRWPYAEYCLMGNQESHRAENMWENAASLFWAKSNIAFNSATPVTFVAIIPFDALFGVTGFLQHYESLGYTVERG